MALLQLNVNRKGVHSQHDRQMVYLIILVVFPGSPQKNSLFLRASSDAGKLDKVRL